MINDRLSHRKPERAQPFRDIATRMRAPHMQHGDSRIILLDARDQSIGITPRRYCLQACGGGGARGCITDGVTGYRPGSIGRDIGRNPVGRGENQGPDAFEAWQSRVKNDLHKRGNANFEAVTECNRQQLRHPVR